MWHLVLVRVVRSLNMQSSELRRLAGFVCFQLPVCADLLLEIAAELDIACLELFRLVETARSYPPRTIDRVLQRTLGTLWELMLQLAIGNWGRTASCAFHLAEERGASLPLVPDSGGLKLRGEGGENPLLVDTAQRLSPVLRQSAGKITRAYEQADSLLQAWPSESGFAPAVPKLHLEVSHFLSQLLLVSEFLEELRFRCFCLASRLDGEYLYGSSAPLRELWEVIGTSQCRLFKLAEAARLAGISRPSCRSREKTFELWDCLQELYCNQSHFSSRLLLETPLPGGNESTFLFPAAPWQDDVVVITGKEQQWFEREIEEAADAIRAQLPAAEQTFVRLDQVLNESGCFGWEA